MFMKKRSFFRSLLSGLLALSVLLGLLPAGVFAVEQASEVQRTVAEDNAARAEELCQRLENLDNPYNEIVDMTGLTESPILEGAFYVVHQDGDTFYALNTVKENPQYKLGSTKVRVEGNRVVQGDLESVLTLTYKPTVTPTAHSLRDENGKYYCAKSVSGVQSFYLYRPTQNYCFIPSGDGCYIRVNNYDITHQGGGLYFLSNTFISDADRLFRFYELSGTVELYRAILDVAHYTEAEEVANYPADMYTRFLNTLQDSLDLYGEMNDSLCRENEDVQIIENQTQELLAWHSELTFNITNADYIDIPIEIMDFRGDTFMFEFVDSGDTNTRNMYALRDPVKEEIGAAPFPATLYKSIVPTTDGSYYNAAQGLVQSELLNGQIVYTEDAVTYVASLVMIDPGRFNTTFMDTVPATDNKWFLEKIDDIQTLAETDRAKALGSMADTIDKTAPMMVDGKEQKVNGGILLSKDVSTAFDLAYYGLNNIWRSVGDDILVDRDENTEDLPYNIVVPERSRLRLYWDPAQKLYSFNSEYELVYDGAYIYNILPLEPSVIAENTPRFMPVNGLGFESEGVETDRSGYFETQGYGKASEGLNYHYAMRASGSFVYYENQDLYFIFHGDDDVYFFIDGKLVMDLGGAHPIVGSELTLSRDKLTELGLDLKDGEAYSFDMFYTERHSTGSNMRLSTNMHIMDTETLTTKGQYLVQTGGKSTVDSQTGMGEARSDGAMMNIGDTVAYSFELLNKRDVPVEDISFEDPGLGVFLSAEEVRMPDSRLTNGAETVIGDLILLYHSYDPVAGKLHSGNLTDKTVGEILSVIRDTRSGAANKPMPTGSYRVKVGSNDELMELLQEGIPPRCQLVIYGFKRNMVADDMPYTNTIRSHCSYIRTSDSLVGAQQEVIYVNGSASRMLRVPDVNSIRIPTAQKLQIVIDYGKPLEISLEAMRERVFVEEPVVLGDFVGLTSSGNNGQILPMEPKDLYCTTTAGDPGVYTTAYGSLIREDQKLTYKLSKMLDTTEKLYAVFSMENCSVMTSETSSADYTHILLELQIIPATMMYYETDFAEGVFKTEAVGSEATPWSTEGTANPSEEFQNNGKEKDQYPTEVTEAAVEDVAMQELSPTSKKPSTRSTVLSGDYVLLDFDTDEVTWTGANMTAATNTETGILSGSLTGNDPHINMDLSSCELNYILQKGNQVQLRLKTNINSGYPWGYKVYLLVEGESRYTEDYAVSSSVGYDNGKWQIFTLDVPDAHAGKRVRALRLDPVSRSTEGADCIGTYELDYIYVGSRNTLPYQDALFFDFTNGEEDWDRYSTRTYKGINYDLSDSWSYSSSGTITETKVLDEEKALFLQNVRDESKASRINFRIPQGKIDFHPSKATLLQVRMKLEDFSGTNPFFRLWWRGTKDGKDYRGYENHYAFGSNFVSDGTYVTYTLDLHSVPAGDDYNDAAGFNGYIDMRELDAVTELYFSLHNVNRSEVSKITIDYLYIGPRGGEPQQDALYFDFTNTSADKERYSNKTYEGHNYDEGRWKGTWRGDAWTAATIADEAITVGMGDYSYAYVQTGGNGAGNLYYIPKKAETVAVRFKCSEEIGLTEESVAYFKFQVIKEGGGTELAHEQVIPIPGDMKVYDGYVTLVADITNTDIRNAEFFNSLCVGFSGLTKSNGTITIDYIYVGPRGAVPSEDQLLFHFTDTAADQKRYNSNTYGYRYNYDTDMDKWIAPYGLEKTVDNTNEGSITASVKTNGTYLEPTDGSQSYLTLPLNYRPSAGDMVQLRFKLNGIKKEDGRNVCLYYGTDDNSIRSDVTILESLTEEDFSGEYVVMTAALPPQFTSARRIPTIRAAFNGIQSADESNPGSVTVDYIYIGPERDLPTPKYTVTYRGETGNVLYTQVVYKGEASAFSGNIPTKTPDSSYHYTFAKWVTTAGVEVDLSNITSDLTLQPKFTAIPHVLVGTVIVDYDPCCNNEITCYECTGCDYEKTEVTQIATGHRFRDGCCAVCGISQQGTILHFQEGAPELSYDWSEAKQTSNLKFDTTGTGFLTGSFNKTTASNCIVGMNAKNTLYNLAHNVHGPDEIVQVRIKIDATPAVQPEVGEYRIFFQSSDMKLGQYYDETHAASGYSMTVDGEGFAIVNIPLPRVAVGRTIRGIRLDFYRGNSTTGISGSYSIDYIYFGQICTAPVPEHSWNQGQILRPSDCKSQGEILQTCFLCGFTRKEPIPLAPCNFAPGAYKAPTCSSTGLKGGSICTVCGKADVAQTVIPMIPHIYEYTDNGNGTHTARCIHCSTTMEEAHSFIYGQCRCGAYEPDYMVYGYDNSYLDDNGLSNGTSLFVKGAGVTIENEEGKTGDTYTRATFSFTGTGFDLISRTGVEQATIRVVVYSHESMKEESRVRALTVNNKGELELYQIPVVSVHDLPYGTYYVAIGVNKAVTYGMVGNVDMSFMNRGSEFYFDAVRIYDPLNTASDTEALEVYKNHGEAYPQVTELRDLLLTAEEFSSAQGSLVGAVFIDASKDNNDDHITTTIATYKNYGPKNETYLYPGQAVAFKLVVDSTVFPKSLDFGVKTIYGGTAVMLAGIGKAVPTVAEVTGEMRQTERSLVSATSLYYSLAFTQDDFIRDEDGSYYTYVVVSNAARDGEENVLSVTDIKVAFDTNPQQPDVRNGIVPVRFMVDGEAFRVAEAFLKGNIAELPLDDGIMIYHSLNLASDISLNYAVEQQSLAGYDSFYLECVLPRYEGNALVGQTVVQLQPVDQGYYYYFTLDGLTAVNMNDTIQATLHMKKEGWSYRSLTDAYSISDYAYNQLEKVGATQKLKTVCAELLRYGAAAQIFKDYRTDALADSKMTATHMAYLSDIEAVTFGNTNKVLNDLEDAPITWAGKSLNLESKVALKFVFSIADYSGNLKDLNLRVTYTDIEGKTVTVTVEEVEAYNAANGQYAFSFDGLLAAELRSVVSVQVCEKDTPMSCTLQYSADTYGNNKTGTLLDLCKALFAYSDSARTYFAN